jgi:hypothetical protein
LPFQKKKYKISFPHSLFLSLTSFVKNLFAFSSFQSLPAMASKRKTRSSSTSGNTVTVTADSNSGDTQKKSRTTILDTASSAVETKQATETVPMKVESNDEEDEVSNSRFLGDPVPDEEAKLRWPKRYQEKVTFLLTICRKLNMMYENSM